MSKEKEDYDSLSEIEKKAFEKINNWLHLNK